MKVLLLGGTGAIGVALVQILTQYQNEVYVTTRKERISKDNVHYIQGDAHKLEFVKGILDKYFFDAIVDFMVYNPQEFEERVEMYLSKTRQYMFLSSSRVYANNGMDKLTEESPRLLDVCADREYLSTNEYALAKAREENILYSSSYKNWTIIRPYITYNDQRFQLGPFEKEIWLRRALDGKTIVFSKDMGQKTTTLTYGQDVANVMAELIGNEKAMEKTLHIATGQTITWQEVLELYLEVIEKELGYQLKTHLIDDSTKIDEACCSKYQIKYDRLYHRSFSNVNISEVLGHKVDYTDVREGLAKCLTNFIRERKQFLDFGARPVAYFDKITGEHTSLKRFQSLKQKVAYIFFRYFKLK